MCPISSNIYGMKLNVLHFSSGTAIIYSLGKPYQEINFKNVILFKIWLVYHFVNKKKTGRFALWFYFTLIVCAHCCNEIEKGQW